jgi:hypothetical protein
MIMKQASRTLVITQGHDFPRFYWVPSVSIASCVVFVRLRRHQWPMAVEGSDLVVLPHGQIVYAGVVADDKSLSENA